MKIIDFDKVQRSIKACAHHPNHDCESCDYCGDNFWCYNDELLSDFDEIIKQVKEYQWNRLTVDSDGIVHGLPGDDGQYLMTDGEDIWIDDYMDGVEDGVFLDSGRDVREIKAWMEMPDLPEDEDT